MTTPVLIRLLGGFRLSVAGREVTSLPRKAQALLGYLAMQDGRPVTRETVSDLLWTDRGAEQARHSLRQTLLVLRRALRDAGGDVIANNPSTLAFVPGMVETDVGRFRLLARSSERALLAEASELYDGSLLDRFPPVGGDFDDWLIVARSEVSDVAIDALRRLTDACLAAGDVAPAVTAAERMLALDLLREDSHRLLMEVYLRAGRRADAIRQYDACVEVLRRELDVGPSEETEGVATRLRNQETLAAHQTILSPPDYRQVWITPRSSGTPWIAVLPFRAIGDDQTPAYFGAGLVEDIIALLATLREPVVISSNSSQIYRETHLDVRRVGRELGISYVVSGSVRKSERWVRVYVELSETEGGTVLWARTYDAEGLAIFDVQDSIATRVVNTVVPHIQERELQKVRTKRPESLSAYDLVLQARELILSLDQTRFYRAGDLLREASHMDPAYAPAHAGLADWYSLHVGQGWSQNPSADIQSLDSAAQTAIACDPNHARALALYGHNRSFLHRDYDQAISLFERAVDVAPNDAVMWKWTSTTFAYVGNGQEAARRARKALDLSPRDHFAYGIYSSACVAHYMMDAFDEAIHWGQLSYQENPRYTSNTRYLCASLVAVGRVYDAREIAQSVLKIEPNFRVTPLVARHPIQDAGGRGLLGERLIEAGLPA